MDVRRKLRRRTIAMVFLVFGILLVNLDLRVRTDIQYPDYEFAEHYGAVTQRMVMEDVVGTSLRVDVLSDFLGYLFLAISVLLVRTYARPAAPPAKSYEAKKEARRRLPRACVRFALIALLGAVLVAAAKLLPFVANGVSLYGPEYFINFGLSFVAGAAVTFATLSFLRECERYQSHTGIMLVYLFLVLTVLSGVLMNLAEFYGLNRVMDVYLVINSVTALVTVCLLISLVRHENRMAREAIKPEPEKVIY